MSNSNLERFEIVLDDVYADLLKGNVIAAGLLCNGIEARLAMIGFLKNVDDAQRIHYKIRRNMTCLQESLHGLRSARRRITDIKSAQSCLSIYNKDGGIERRGTIDGNLERRL